jgi:y4mF family transcriptional regulator
MRAVRTTKDLGAAVRGRRQTMRWSQQRLAETAGVSRRWVSELERGKRTAEIGLVLAVVDALDLDVLLPVRSARDADGPADEANRGT